MCVNVVFYFKFAFVWEGRGLVSGSLLFILGVGGSVVLKLNFVWGWFYLEFLGDYFLLRGFFFINFFSPFWGGTLLIFVQHSLIHYVHPPGGWIYYFCFFRRPMSDVRCPMSDVRRPMSGVTHGFRSFKGKVLELLSPNLVCRLIGSVACLGLLLAVVPLLLTE